MSPAARVASSRNAKERAGKAVAKFGTGFALANGNGSGNMGEARSAFRRSA